MNIFIGTKIVKARPMSLGDYNEYRGWELPADENAEDEGYLVEYLDGGKPNVFGHEGYVSWSPKAVFQNSYRPSKGLNFGLAIEAMRIGKKVSRVGWNGKGMYLYLVPEGRYLPTTPAGHELANQHSDRRVPYKPYIAMKTVDNEVVPWLASQTDMLANDWEIIE